MHRDGAGLNGLLPPRFRAAIARRVGIDPRGLGALRMSVGLLLLADLALRAGDLVAFYTDAGVLPRSVLAEEFPAFAAISIHALSGTAWFEGLLFLVAATVGVALVAGYHTRLATVISLLLLVSLHARNPILLNAGDSLLRRLLFWGLFLPLGGRWAVDAMGQRDRRDRVVGVATAALLLQVVLVYTTNAVFKLRGELWRSGEAIRYVFGLDHLTVGLGDALASYPTLLVALDRLWLAMLVGSVLLIVVTGRARTALVGLFVGAHLGMALTMRLGLFPLISIAALLPFLPPSAWDRIESVLAAVPDWLRVRVRAPAWRPPRLLPHAPAGVADSVRQLAPTVVAVCLVLVLVWNAAAIGLVATPAGVTTTVDPEQHRWDMFAPEPRTTDGWYVVDGRLASGDRVDPLHGGDVTFERPPDLSATFPSHRWFVYLLDLQRPGYADLRPAFAGYLCRRWNADHADALVAVTVYFVAEPVRLDAPEDRHRVELYRGSCAPA